MLSAIRRIAQDPQLAPIIRRAVGQFPEDVKSRLITAANTLIILLFIGGTTKTGSDTLEKELGYQSDFDLERSEWLKISITGSLVLSLVAMMAYDKMNTEVLAVIRHVPAAAHPALAGVAAFIGAQIHGYNPAYPTLAGIAGGMLAKSYPHRYYLSRWIYR